MLVQSVVVAAELLCGAACKQHGLRNIAANRSKPASMAAVVGRHELQGGWQVLAAGRQVQWCWCAATAWVL